MINLKQFSELTIDWNLSPEHAVTMYLEWGNNDWHAEYPPVRSKDDISHYFVVDTWGPKPIIRLVRRNSEAAVDLIAFDMPDELIPGFKVEFGELRGIFEPGSAVKDWLKAQMH